MNDELHQLLPRPDRHVAIFGPTGFGKSELTRQLASNFSNVIVIDPKRDWSWGDLARDDPKRYRLRFDRLDRLRRELNRIARDRTGEPVVYQPRIGQLRSWLQTIDEIPLWALTRKDTIVIYDELETCVRSSDWEYKASNFAALIYQGRSGRAVAWCLCKRPQRVPFVLLSECRVRYIFHLGTKEARTRAEEICDTPIPWDSIKQPFRWIYSDDFGTLGPYKLKDPRGK